MIPTDPQDDVATDMPDAPVAPDDMAADNPPAAQPEPEEETDEQWRMRFIEENQHLARPRIERPPPPPPSPWDGPPSSWKVPDHLSLRHPKGGYMAMALFSRTMDDLDEITKGDRAATYEEVDKYLGHALIAEGLVPFTYTADEAIRWWKSGGYRVLGGGPLASPPSLPDTSSPLEYDWQIDPGLREDRAPDGPQLSSAAFMVDRSAGNAAQAKPAIFFNERPSRSDATAFIEDDDSVFRSALSFAPTEPVSSGSAAARAAPRDASPVKKAPGNRSAAPLGTDLSAYDTGFGDKAHGFHGDYRTTAQERAWLAGVKPLMADEAYPDGLPGHEKLSPAGRRKVRNDVAYLYTLPEVKAFLDLISFTEGTAKYGYFHGHDNPKPNRLPDLTTFHGDDPIGRYQIEQKAWKNFGGSWWSKKDFSEITQDIIAITMLRQWGVIDELLKGNLSGALTKASDVFASIPVSLENDRSGYTKSYVIKKTDPKTGKEISMEESRDQPTPIKFQDLPAEFARYLKNRRAEFSDAEEKWKTEKTLPKAFISPMKWRSFGLSGF